MRLSWGSACETCNTLGFAAEAELTVGVNVTTVPAGLAGIETSIQGSARADNKMFGTNGRTRLFKATLAEFGAALGEASVT